MDVDFEDPALYRLETDASFDAGLDRAIVRTFRMQMQLIRAADDERAFYCLKSLHFEKLKGDRLGQSSMRLNGKWRLLLRFTKDNRGKVVIIISIEDYH